MARICIVVVTFDRLASFERLCASLRRADYSNDCVDLLISVDGGPRSEGMIEAMEEMDWQHGVVRVRRMEKNYGLRRHILECCRTVYDYDAIILLEDDIVVGENFYAYAQWAVLRYQGDDRVAGISLYSPEHNEMADLPFTPAPSGQDVYALQSAQSWGQCWTRSMWRGFEEWYVAHGEKLHRARDMPERIYSWPDSSWKKFAMKYLVETGRTWIYPYQSHSTNCSEVGTHNKQESALYQVPLAAGRHAFFGEPLDELLQYDIYFERVDADLPAAWVGRNDIPLMCDFYATKQQAAGPAYLLTTRKLPIAPVERFGIVFKPQELNIARNVPGDVVRLYEIDAGQTIDLSKFPAVRAVEYFGQLNWQDQLKAGLRGFSNAVSRRLKYYG